MPRTKPLLDWLSARDNVAHTAQARAAGFSKYDMAVAASAGLIRRVRRSWIAAPSADHRAVAAVAVGGRLTCLSVASRHGLWVPAHDEVHVALPRNTARFDSEGLRAHWRRTPMPTAQHAVAEPLINALLHVAECVPRVDALAVWESALRKTPLTSDMLGRVQWRSSRARELAAAASVLSDSGLETHVIHGIRRMGVACRQQVVLDGRPVDVLIGERLVVQLDGFAHHGEAAQRRRDIRGDAQLVLRGYTVLRFDYQQVLFDWPYVEATIAAAIAQGLHRAP